MKERTVPIWCLVHDVPGKCRAVTQVKDIELGGGEGHEAKPYEESICRHETARVSAFAQADKTEDTRTGSIPVRRVNAPVYSRSNGFTVARRGEPGY